MNRNLDRRPVPAPFAVPIASTAFLVLGAVTTSAGGRIGAHALLAGCAAIVAVTSTAAEPLAVVPVVGVGWLTAVGFSGPPYADLHLGGSFPRLAAEVLASTGVATTVLAVTARAAARRVGRRVRAADVVAAATALTERSAAAGVTLTDMPAHAQRGGTRGKGLIGAVGRRRQGAGLALGVALLPLATVVLVSLRPHLTLADDLLIYLVTLVAITVVGGFWPAVVAAIASSLLLNWFFTPPLHTWSIDQPQNMLALLLFVTVALGVGSVVHLSARRADDAAVAGDEAAALLSLARTVLAGADTPLGVLEHLREREGVTSELQERTGATWTTVARSGRPADGAARVIVPVNEDTRLVLHERPSVGGRVIEGFAAQAVAALDRERLRIQAAQAEALAEGNRIRTALLAAVSHDLRTPLASIKASVSSLRQGDVTWSAEDESALLATIEESADRLDALVGNLLDMSRLQTGSLEPFLRPTAVDEVVPVALRGLEGGDQVHLAIPETLPLVATDPGLLERALANLIANALRHSPPGRPPTVDASVHEGTVVISVVDHGPGVPHDARDRIFEPFQRLGDRTGAAGVGLGLAVARGFVEAMGGSITPVDTVGGGLTMTVRLRRAHADPRPVDPARTTT